jgi:hypothetical protein
MYKDFVFKKSFIIFSSFFYLFEEILKYNRKNNQKVFIEK